MNAPSSNGVQRLLKEPLVHFLFLAGLLFAAQALFAPDDRDEIVVDKATQEFLIERERGLTLRSPGPEDVERLVNGFIDDEILIREARKRGYADSSRIRALLLENMRFLIASDIPEPTEEALRNYFEANIESFTSPLSLDLDHLFFDEPEAVPSDMLERLNAGADRSDFLDATPVLGPVSRGLDTRRLSELFGPDSTKRILDIAEDDASWNGPILDPAGRVHFLRIVHRNPPKVMDFETSRDWIASQWIMEQTQEVMGAELDAMRQDYRVIVEPLGES